MEKGKNMTRNGDILSIKSNLKAKMVRTCEEDADEEMAWPKTMLEREPKGIRVQERPWKPHIESVIKEKDLR